MDDVMARIGLITFSDGRDFVYRDLDQFTSRVEDRDRAVLEARGHDVVRAAGRSPAARPLCARHAGSRTHGPI